MKISGLLPCLLLSLALLCCTSSSQAADPHEDPSGASRSIYGFEGGEYLRPTSIEDLEKLEESRPDLGYTFDASHVTRRLDAGLFDPYLDTSEAKNTSIGGWKAKPDPSDEKGLSPICFGITVATARWWQENVSPHLIRQPEGEYSIGAAARRLRNVQNASREERIRFLRSARDHQDQDIGLASGFQNWNPLGEEESDWEVLDHDDVFFRHLWFDLRNPRLGGTDLGLSLNQGPEKNQRRKFHHAVLAYGLLEGVAVAPNGHRVRAVRVEIADSNFPRETPAEAATCRGEDYLIYFPRARRFGIGRDTVWRRKQTYDRVKNADAATQAHYKAIFDKGLFLQDTSTYLGRDQIKINRINDPESTRRRIAATQAYGFRSIDRYNEEIREDLVQQDFDEQVRFTKSLAQLDAQVTGGGSTAPLIWVGYKPPVIDEEKVGSEVDRRLHRAYFEEKTTDLH